MQLSFGLIGNFGNGKLLGCGDSVNGEPEKISKSLTLTPIQFILPALNEDDGDVDKTFETSFGRSFGSGPNGTVDATIKDLADTGAASAGFKSCLGSSFLMGCLDFLGVRD